MRFELVVLALFSAFFISVGVINATPLDDYVNAPDPNYGYELLQTYEMTGYTLYILNFTSQKWLDGNFNASKLHLLIYLR